MLAAVLDPLDRPPQQPRGEGDQHLLGIDQHDLHAEAAAHIRRDHGEGGLRHAQLLRDDAAGGDRRLRGVPDRERVEARIVLGDDAAGLHRLGRAAFGPELLAQHMVGFGEGARDIAAPVGGAAGDVRPGIVVDERRTRLRRRHEIDRRRLGRIVHFDQLQRVLGEIAALGHHQRHRLADEAYTARRERPVGARMDESGVLVQQRHGRVGGAQILVGEHRVDAAERQRRVRIDAGEAGLGVGAAQHRRVGHVGQADVVDEAGAPGEQPRVLAPRDRLADQPRGHGLSPRSIAAARRTAATICW